MKPVFHTLLPIGCQRNGSEHRNNIYSATGDVEMYQVGDLPRTGKIAHLVHLNFAILGAHLICTKVATHRILHCTISTVLLALWY